MFVSQILVKTRAMSECFTEPVEPVYLPLNERGEDYVFTVEVTPTNSLYAWNTDFLQQLRLYRH